jgi:predicted patatin/cPLA2 family phospholipase
MNGVGLVLEGGGMRGVYTAGVLDFFMENKLSFPYVIGVSAGACNGTSYISNQIGRNKRVNTEYLSHPDYISFKNLVRKKQLFGMDLLFDIIPNELDPFDFESFFQSDQRFMIGTTDVISGQPMYFDKNDLIEKDDLLKIVRASSSLPLMAPIVEFNSYQLLDGGIADPIPLQKSEMDGNQKNVVVLTRNAGYIKKKSRSSWLLNRQFKEYPNMAKAVSDRHRLYNEQIAYIEEQEQKGNVFVIRPSEKLLVGRVERNRDRLLNLYLQGYEDTKKQMEALQEFLQKEKSTC